MSDLAVSFGIGATLGASVSAVTGSTVKHLERLRKTTAATERASAQVSGYRAMRSSLGAATASMRAAEGRAATLSRQIQSTAHPTAELRRRFAAARAESGRLAGAVGRQRRALVGQARALRESGVAVSRLREEEDRLARTLRQQIAHRDRLARAVDAGSAARARRESARGDLVEAGALGYAVLRPMQAVVGQAVEFEEKMADIGKVVDFPRPGGLQAMGRDLLELSTRIPVAASGLADIVAEAGQAGVARGELMRFAADSAKVAVAFDLTGRQAGEAMAGLRTIFALGQDDVMDLAGAYNHLSNSMAARAPDLLDIANRAGGMARIVGLSGQQLGAIGATMLALKTPPEVAGTAINAMLTKLRTLGSEGPKVQAALSSIGLSARGVEAAMRQDAETAVVSVLEAVGKSDDVVGTLKALFGMEYADDVAKLVGSLDEYAKARRLASAEEARAASVESEYAVRAGTTANALQLAGNRVRRLAVNVGSALLPGINAALGPLGALADVGATLAERYPGVASGLVMLTTGLVVGKVALVAYRYAAATLGQTLLSVRARLVLLTPAVASARAWLVGTVSSLAGVPRAGAAAAGGVGKVTAALRVLRLALVSTGVGAVVVALGLAAAWLMRNWEPVKAFFAGVGRGIGAALDAMGPVGAVLRGIGEVVGDVIGWIAALFAPVEASEAALTRWGAAGEKVGMAIGAAFATALAPIRLVVGAAAKAIDVYRAWRGIADDEQPAAAEPPKPGAAVGAAKRTAAVATVAAGATFAAAPSPTQDVVPATAFPVPIRPGAPPAATTSSAAANVRVEATINVQPPAGADEQAIAREVARQLADAMRRAAVEAGLGESD